MLTEEFTRNDVYEAPPPPPLPPLSKLEEEEKEEEEEEGRKPRAVAQRRQSLLRWEKGERRISDVA